MCFGRVSISVNWVYVFIFNICFIFCNMPLVFPLFYHCLIRFHCLFPWAFQLVPFSVVRKRQSFKLLEEKGGWKKMQEIWTGPRHCGDQCLRLHWGSKSRTFPEGIKRFPNLARWYWEKQCVLQAGGWSQPSVGCEPCILPHQLQDLGIDCHVGRTKVT